MQRDFSAKELSNGWLTVSGRVRLFSGILWQWIRRKNHIFTTPSKTWSAETRWLRLWLYWHRLYQNGGSVFTPESTSLSQDLWSRFLHLIPCSLLCSPHREKARSHWSVRGGDVCVDCRLRIWRTKWNHWRGGGFLPNGFLESLESEHYRGRHCICHNKWVISYPHLP